jgi:hypothetical protein
MEKSIEAIWKEGFLNEKSLVAPKINDLYNQKSKDLVDRMKRMYRNNLIALVSHGDCFSHYVLFPGYRLAGNCLFYTDASSRYGTANGKSEALKHWITEQPVLTI